MRKETREAISLFQNLYSEGKMPIEVFNYLIRLAAAIEMQYIFEQMFDKFFKRIDRKYTLR